MSIYNQKQRAGSLVIGDRIDLLGGLFAAMALCSATVGMASPSFPWWSYEWSWWDWDHSGLKFMGYHIYSGLAVMVLSAFGWICSFAGVVSAIVGVRARSLAIPRLILFAGAVVAILALLDLGHSLGLPRSKPGFGVVLALASGLGSVVAATGMNILFAASFAGSERDQGSVQPEEPSNDNNRSRVDDES